MNRDEVTKELTLGRFDDALITLYGDNEETLAAQRNDISGQSRALRQFIRRAKIFPSFQLQEGPRSVEIIRIISMAAYWQLPLVWMPSPSYPFIMIM